LSSPVRDCWRQAIVKPDGESSRAKEAGSSFATASHY
jgi:hypothetical protein